MPTPTEHKTVQARILEYAQEIGRTFVPRAEANRRRSFQATVGSIAGQVSKASLYFDDLFFAKVQEFKQGARDEGHQPGKTH